MTKPYLSAGGTRLTEICKIMLVSGGNLKGVQDTLIA